MDIKRKKILNLWKFKLSVLKNNINSLMSIELYYSEINQ